MQFKLIISSNSETSDEHLLEKERIFQHEQIVHIGRGHPNEVPLEDPFRKISRIQARIVSINNTHILEDLSTKNNTYVNNSLLKPGQKTQLQSGDIISIGDYHLRYIPLHMNGTKDATTLRSAHVNGNSAIAYMDAPVEQEQEQEQKPTPEPEPIHHPPTDLSNPFSQIVDYTARAVEALCILYDSESPQSRSNDISLALQAAFNGLDAHPVIHQFRDTFSELSGDTPNPTNLSPHTPIPHTPIIAPEPAQPKVGNDHSELVVNALILMLQRISSIPYEFKKSFLGETELPDNAVKYLLTGNTQKIMLSLLDKSQDEALIKKRLGYLYQGISSLQQHHKGMLAGYNTAALQSIDLVLNELDPVYIEQVLRESQKGVFKSVRKDTILDTIKDKAEELRKIDATVYEQRVLRPAFIEGYLEGEQTKDQKGKMK